MQKRARRGQAHTLSGAAKGAMVRIQQLPTGEMRAFFIRLGIVEGVLIQVLQRLPGGTMIVLYGRQEVALSAELAGEIRITHE